jgi:hypothetical protein
MVFATPDDLSDNEDSGSSSSDDDEKINILRDLDRPKLPIQKIDKTISSPLPLIIFKGLGVRSSDLKTINGVEIKPMINNLSPTTRSGENLHDLMYTRKLIKFFFDRSYIEAAIRQPRNFNKAGPLENCEQYSINDHLVYKSTSFDSDKSPLSRTNKSAEMESESISNAQESSVDILKGSLVFDSNFESGNLLKAVRVTGRENLTINLKKSQKFGSGDFIPPEKVDQEYDLTLRNDLNTSGNIQWYYFSASTEDIKIGFSKAIVYPLRVRFNIVNMHKKDALYNFGMKPATFSSNCVRDDWRHRGEDVCYYKQCVHSAEDMSVRGDKKGNDKYILTFTYTFLGPVTVHFAHAYPYTYTDLKRYLASLEENPRVTSIMNRRELCTTIAGNSCECITITSKTCESNDGVLKPAIVISARIHPGETNSSYIMNGVIDFLISENPEAQALRDNFIFKIVPMLNPDGVIHGNYRCSLIGTDLNRRYLDPHPSLYPTVSAMKNLLDECQKKRGVFLFLDLHGHSKKKSAFCYGNDCTFQSDKLRSAAMSAESPEDIVSKRIFARSFPKVLSKLTNPNFHS